MTSFRGTLRRSWPVLLSYGLFSIWGVSCLVMSLVLTSGGFGVSPGDLGVLFGVLFATLLGHIGGSLLGLIGLRMFPITLVFGLLFAFATFGGLVVGAFALFMVIAIVAALGGYLGTASRLDVVAAWYPLSFCVGGAIVWMNRHGAIETFHHGSKYALWDGYTMLCLAGGVFLMLVFLATRHSLGLTVWQDVARPRRNDLEEDPRSVARPGRGSFFVLFGFTMVILGVTALIAPYLFRTREDPDAKHGKSAETEQKSGESTGPHGQASKQHGQASKQHGQASKQHGRASGDESASQQHGQSANEQHGQSASQQHGQSASQQHGQANGDENASGERGDLSNDPLGDPDAEQTGNAAGEALRLGMSLFMWLLAALAALLFVLLVALPPIRRSFLLRHLERPLWPVAPTARVMNLWRRALALLAVVEVEPLAGETPRDFARRAADEVSRTLGCESPGLSEAAAIVEKVDYAGRGLGVGEEAAMREAVDSFVRRVEPRIGFTKKLVAAWGTPPEVES